MRDQPQNITAVNRIAAVLFTELYESFPNPKQLNSIELGANASPADSEYEQSFDYCSTSTHVVTWLAEEGFLRHGTVTYGGTFTGVRLTMKGLSVLGQVPSTVKPGEPSESIATRLKKAVSKGAEAAASDSIKSLLAQVFELALRYGNPISNSGILSA